MIDEKKLLEVLEKWDDYLGKKSDGFSMLKWTTIIRLKSLVTHQPKIGEWIPCSERLPESGQRCLVSVVWGDEGAKTYSVYDAVYGSDAKWHSHNYEGMICCLIYCKVVAWQPLPEPYKE